ncbi:MAG: HAD family phosphatase [Proteobacteria bacterium]|nr:HAD family phosphatase [Pseudomonadota bacterium]
MDIVFDIGNVILEWNPQKLLDSLFSCKTENKEAMENIIAHEDWQMLDKGTLSLEEAISRANDRCHIGVNKIRKLFEETPKSLIPIQETVDVIMELSEKGYSLYVLSNMHKHSFEYLSGAYDIWKHFSGIVISSHIKSIKPEPEIFEYLIGTYNLIPRNTVFLDDLKCNIAIAKKFGLNTIHVKNASQSKEELYQMIGI